MSTAQDDLQKHFVQILKDSSRLADAQVFEDLDIGLLPPDVETAVLVRIENSVPILAAINGGPTNWETTLRVDCVRRTTAAPGGASPAWELYADAFAALTGNANWPADTLQVSPGPARPDRDMHDQALSAIEAYWQVLHRTPYDTIDT